MFMMIPPPHSRCFQHDFAHSGHRAQAVRRVLDGQVLVLWAEGEQK